MARANAAVTFAVRYPDRHSRATLLAKTFLGGSTSASPMGSSCMCTARWPVSRRWSRSSVS